MKLHEDRSAALNTVTGYGAGFIEINGVRHQGHLIVTPESPVEAWSTDSFEALTADDFDGLRRFEPEVVLLGTGTRQRFAHPRLLRPLTQAHIGVECMDSAAACRTYNILMNEGRRVLAAFLQEDVPA